VLNGPLFSKPLEVEIESSDENESEYGISLKLNKGWKKD
jgi:hypothetical protein